jgi:hypothetical protein
MRIAVSVNGISLPDFGGGIVVQNHVHPRQCAGGVVHFLTEYGQTTRRFIAGF